MTAIIHRSLLATPLVAETAMGMYIIDKQGNIVNKIEGTRKKEEFERMIKALM